MPVVDVLLILLMVLFAISGYRQGFVIGALSLGGFFSGVLIGLQLGPLAARQFENGTVRLVVALGVILVLAVLGQTLAGWLGTNLRQVIQSRPMQYLDDAGGAIVSVVAVLFASWLVAVPFGSTPFPAINAAVRDSAILGGVTELIPDEVRALSSGLRDTIDTNGFPDVFGGLARTQAREVAAPDPALAGSKVVKDSRSSVLKILGSAPSCSRRIEGTG
ncbi:MAG TPA: CvpA family protein, partial [Actinoplanes sp.]|nr:CvpA family protein [Actinoplanes sp.]